MKIRDKKTGAIYKIEDIDLRNNADGIWLGMTKYNSLAELNADWEDAPEEPKDSEYYWYIGYKNDIRRTKYHHISNFADNQVTATRKEIGNCFESLEEAEKAVEKLKAWKRLKDKGVEFYGWRRNQTGTYELYMRWEDRIPRSYEIKNDLDLLFSGEDD